MNRQEALRPLRENPAIPVLVIGGGINGIGTFRDLALQGVDVLLVERGDFCSGASAASSHMVHGGIRYLENGEFRLVREAVRERNLLLLNAPHAVKPLPTAFPVFRWFSGIFNAPLKCLGLRDRPAERGLLVLKIGMMAYDAYTWRHRVMPTHRVLWRRKALETYPALNPRIIAVATYYDAAMPSPERICMDLIHDAEADYERARALNYVSVVSAAGEAVTLRDELTGETFEVRPQVVVNAAGPWIDFVNRALGYETRFIGGTKGSHIILDHPELRAAIGDHEFFFENKDGRIVLIFPYLDKVMVGTTDIRIDNPDDARCTDEEIEYFLELIQRVFPGMDVNRSHIVFQFSGVRPLPYVAAGDTGWISRDYRLRVIEPRDEGHFPIFCLIGGKWTTYRAFSERVTDRVLARLGMPRRASTASLPIGGGKGYPRDARAREAWIQRVSQKTGVPADRVEGLLERYGSRAEEVALTLAAGEDRPLVNLPAYSRREITHLIEREKVAHLDDIVLRRTLIAWLGQLTPALVEELAEIAGDALGWPQKVRQAEIQRLVDLLADRHGVILA